MNIDKIKKYVNDNLERHFLFRINGSRNQKEEFEGIIFKSYKSIFLIKLFNDSVKSFSYSDVLIGNIEIVDI